MTKKNDKDPHAVDLGRRGGKARAVELTAEKRREIAGKAARARWAKERKARKFDGWVGLIKCTISPKNSLRYV